MDNTPEIQKTYQACHPSEATHVRIRFKTFQGEAPYLSHLNSLYQLGFDVRYENGEWLISSDETDEGHARFQHYLLEGQQIQTLRRSAQEGHFCIISYEKEAE